MKDSLNIAIAGATGYVGLELIKYNLSNNHYNKAYDDYLNLLNDNETDNIIFDFKINKNDKEEKEFQLQNQLDHL